tara:strand:+ start:121 stop:435 length:315 start_codon:yes stop_codon:yes gene_type:complete
MNQLSKSDIEAMTYTQCVNEIHSASKYINTLIDVLSKKIQELGNLNWEEVKGVPNEKVPIKFRNSDGDWLDGVYIKSEQMFFLGFETSGDFLFHSDVTDWNYLK